MAYVSPEYVKATQLKHNLVFWKITDKTKKTVIDRNNSTSLNNSIDELQNALNITGDYVVVFLYSDEPEKTTAGSTRGKMLELTVKLNDPYVNKNAGIGGIGLDYIIAAAKNEASLMLEIEKLKMQQNEVKPISIKTAIAEQITQNPEIVQNLLTKGLSIGGNILDMISNKNKGIGKPEILHQDTINVLKKFEKIDPEYFSVLKRMAEMCELMPVMYWKTKKELQFDVPEDKLK
jgi:hypothetical protein